MRCRHCPLCSYDLEGNQLCYLLPIADESCELVYEDRNGKVIGCYVEKCLITKKAKRIGVLKND